MQDGLLIRPATADDIETLVRLRRAMFESMGCTDATLLAASDQACTHYFRSAIPAGEYTGWLVQTASGESIATGGVIVDCHPPGPVNLDGRVGYILNLYTKPDYRRQGLGSRIMELVLAWIKTSGIGVATLHASEMGRLLYSQMGFEQSNEMKASV